MDGIFGKYVDIDLTAGTVADYAIPERWYELYLGGRGIGARILLAELTGTEDPLSPDNVLVFATGPFQGTGIAGAGRHAVLALSPKTKAVADSYVGGFFGYELGRSGYDGIIVRGRAERPVYISLINGKAEINPADDLWGKGVGETEATLRARYPRGRVAAIGPAGENLVQMACIMHDVTRSAGRPGLGAVMGAKNLKAIVVHGDQEKPVHNHARFAQLRAEFARSLLDPDVQQFGEYGTIGGLTWLSERGILPTKNFQEGTFDQAEEISGTRLHDTFLVGRDTCAGCPIRCKRVVATEYGGRKVDPRFGGPEYETAAAFGSLCMNNDLRVIALANQLCNDYGLDTISAGVAVATVMEASEQGLIQERVPWGDGEKIIELVEKIAHRDGIGDRIAAGVERFAAEIGAEFAMTIKGVEVPMHEPRGKQALGLSYATSPRGATHMEGIHDTMLETDHPTPELGIDQPYDRFTLRDKPWIGKVYEDLRSFTNSLVMCAFTVTTTGKRYNLPQIRDLLTAVTGIVVTPQSMIEFGERNYALMRLHAARAGYTIDHDGLPRRFHEPLPRGASAGHPVDPDELKAAIADYYAARGYDRYGPTDATLHRLGMDDLIGVIKR